MTQLFRCERSQFKMYFEAQSSISNFGDTSRSWTLLILPVGKLGVHQGLSYQSPLTSLDVPKHQYDCKEIFMSIRKRKLMFLNLVTYERSSILNFGTDTFCHPNCCKLCIDPVYLRWLHTGMSALLHSAS